MSSDLFVFDNSFFSDPFSPFPDSAADAAHHHFPFQTNLATAASPSFDQITSALLSSSPPSVQLQNLSLSHLSAEVKTEEECRLNPDAFPAFNDDSFVSPHETALKLMQRSFSSNSFENATNLSFRPHFDSIFESNNLHPQIFEGQIRRVCSTGDLHKMKTNMQSRTVLSSSSPLSAEKSFMEEANFKVGRYSAEERKERIDRYRAKRTHRNFNKTIKYACRKTLADTRPRIRGRFARNDDAGEMPKASMFQRYEDDDDLWMSLQMEGLHEDDDDRVAQKATYINYNNYSY